MYAAVRIRGSVNVNKKAKDTLNMLCLTRPNHCVLVEKTRSNEGMLKSVANYITWGEVGKDVLFKLVLKRGRLSGNKRLDDKAAKEEAERILKKRSKIKSVFRLSPPKKGFRSIRSHYPKGDLGYRGEKINELLEKMV